MTELSADKLHEDANELVLNDQFEKALNLYTTSIEKCEKTDTNLLFNNHLRRSEVNVKLKKFQDALNDAEKAIDLNKNDSRGFLKKGIALFNQNNFSAALNALEEGLKVAENESNVKRELINEWIDKCKNKLPKQETPKQAEVIAQQNENSQPQNSVQKPPQYKHEWYQTESNVTVSILVKNVTSNDVTINSTENELIIKGNNQDNLPLNFNFNLANKVVPEQTQIKFLTNKIEIKLKKVEGIQWKKLELDPTDTAKKIVDAPKPSYPTSSKKPKNWDAIAADVDKEEEKLEGDNALNKLFQQVYQNGSDETRKAMNKSFVESGGTVLSTNWSDVGSKKLEVKPPDGMEWKKWDE